MIIPFFIPHAGCPHQCVFCNQKSITGRTAPPDISSISFTVDAYLKTGLAGKQAQIAFYGGSFTALPVEAQKKYLDAALPFIQSAQVEGIRISTRPDCIDREGLSFLEGHHVTTVELGAQSLNDRVLELAGRGHSSSDTVNAVKLLRKSGFLVGLQLMPGLPGDSADGFLDTVDKAIALGPDFVRIYPALVITGTPLEKLYGAGRYTPLSLEDAIMQCSTALKRLERSGIRVIRIGLQSTEELEKPGTIVAGPYHPAFRQLVDSALFLDRLRRALRDAGKKTPVMTLRVNSADLSAAVGQKRSNLTVLKKEFGLDQLVILPNPLIARGSVSQ